MSKPIYSGIIGLIAVAIGVIGFTQSWIDYKIMHILTEQLTGLDILSAPLDHGISGGASILILLGLIGGVVSSVYSFLKEGDNVRVFFFLCFFGAFIGSVLAAEDVGSMPYYHGTGYAIGIGLWMEMLAGLLLFVAIVAPDKK